ncbi:response regulator [bacterium]|nr:response regulator [bacterium]RQV93740.1 MAG: response regulator [bacterium]
MKNKSNSQINKESFLSDAQFEEERLRLLNWAVTVGALLAVILVPIFGILDLVLKYHIISTFLAIRISVTLISLAVYFLAKSAYGGKQPYVLGAFLTLVVGGSIALMCYLDQGPSDPYYAGINLPLLGFGILLPLKMTEAIFIFVLVWLSYFIPNLLILQPYETQIFISNNFFMLSTIIISLASSQFHLSQRKTQWYTHQKLQLAHQKIQCQTKDLRKKVKERTQRLLQSERLAVVGQLAGGVAHDFNNILTAILGFSQLLLDSLPAKSPLRNDVKSIAESGERAVDLVKQLLAFSRRQILSPKVINLNDEIINIEKMLSRVIGEDIELVIDRQENLGNIMADPIQIEQIVLNLSVNARDAMPKGGRLTIRTARVTLDKSYCRSCKISLAPGDYVLLSVSDIGEGMSEDVKVKIFEPFFTTKKKGKGTGLGLSTVLGIVKQSQGEITVSSRVGMGTTITIYFPCVQEALEKGTKNRNYLSQLPKGRETILLVEDEDEVRRLTARMLTKQGYRVMQAKEGKAALSLSKEYEGPIDLLVTDVIMPQMNGKILAEHLIAQRASLKVLYISGHIDSMITQQGIVDVDSDLLQKPYTFESLNYKIRNIFDN